MVEDKYAIVGPYLHDSRELKQPEVRLLLLELSGLPLAAYSSVGYGPDSQILELLENYLLKIRFNAAVTSAG